MRTIRDVVIPLILVVGAVLLGTQTVIAAYVVLGYGHFLLGYIYRVRAGRESAMYLTLVPAVVLCVSGLYFMLGGALVPLFVVTAFIFAAHFSLDEYFLHSVQLSGSRWTVLVAFLGIDFVLSVGLVVPGLMSYGQVVSLIFLAVIAVQLSRGRASAAEQYLGFVGALLFLMAVAGYAQLMLGVIVLLHCYNWYDWGYARAAQKHGVLLYVRDVALTLGVFVVLYGVYATGVAPSFGQYFAESSYYYYYFPLALAHIATSVRFG